MPVLLYPNPTKDESFVVTRQAACILRDCGETPLASEEYREQLQGNPFCFLPAEKAFASADKVVTIGGDGTLLRASAQCLASHLPVLGVNLGRTGFLATCEVSEMAVKLSRLAAGDYTREPRSLLLGSVASRGWSACALNDFVVFGRSRLHPMDYSIYCDGAFVCHYRSDGVILSTPTGSTAYSLSAGGPILDAAAAVFLVNGICTHDIYSAPLVFSAARKVTVEADPENRDTVFACADSRMQCPLEPGERLEIELAKQMLDLISFDGAEQFKAIGNKLMRR